jgi:hypothetical protein
LDCVALEVRSTEEWPALNVTKSALRDAFLVGVRSKLPRLTVDPSCKNVLAVLVFLRDISTDQLDVAYGMVTLRVERPVVILDTRENITGDVWSENVAILHGPRNSIRSRAMGNLDDLINAFGAAYYRAGNR